VNVCRHRGSQIALGRGRRETLQCPYQAWTYDLDGSLRAAPRSEREQSFERSDLSLRPALVQQLGPFVFVCADLDAPPLDEALDGMPELLARDLHLHALVFRERAEYEEGRTGRSRPRTTSSATTAPWLTRASPGSLTRAPTTTLRPGDGVWTQLGRSRDGDGSCQFHLVWPALKVNVYPGPPNLSIGPVWPVGAERTAGFLDYFFGAGVSAEEASELIAFDDQVGREDAALVESVQRGVRSGMIDRGRLLLDSETLVNSFQRRIFAALS